MCQRPVGRGMALRRLALLLGTGALALMLLLVLIAPTRLEWLLLRRHATPAAAYSAAVAYIGKSPQFRGAMHIGNLKETAVERLGPTRYRVAGYLELQPEPGVRVHDYYTCAVVYMGHDTGWQVEDLHFERLQ